MNIKSLLLGSAAALLAVSGARAADAVTVAEPEPAEYVKICDVYGAGYFYIPGTETCLRIGGSLRYTIGIGDIDGGHSIDKKDDDGTIHDTYHKSGEFRFDVSTAQETELGTLKTFVEGRYEFGNGVNGISGVSFPGLNLEGNGGLDFHFGYIQLGGFRVGLDESLFSTYVGYAGNVINDTLIGYGPFQTPVVQYYFDAGNGFSAAISLEEGFDSISPSGGPSLSTLHSVDSYMPHVVGGLKYVQGWGDIIGVVAYDSNDNEVTGKVRLDVKASDALTLWIMGGYGSADDPASTSGYTDFYKNWGGNWAVWGGGTYTFSPKASFNTQISYDEAKTLAVVANIDYQPVAGFHVIPELNFVHDSDGTAFNDKKNAWGGLLRFQRDF
jgi:hypothetical protein